MMWEGDIPGLYSEALQLERTKATKSISWFDTELYVGELACLCVLHEFIPGL